MAIVCILIASSAAGAVALGVAPLEPVRKQGYVLAPFEFQLNGTEPYTIGVTLARGETIDADVNITGVGTMLFTLKGSVIQSDQLSGNAHYEFTAASRATYQLIFQSDGKALVWFDVRYP